MVARYQEVARSLAQRIEEAVYPVGSQLPTEVELAESYAVSRATVRSALDSLERVGMVSRRRRIGTLVQAVRPRSGYARTVSTMHDLVQYSAETERRVLDQEEIDASPELADLIGCEVGRRLVHIRMLRLDERGLDRPLCYTDVYLLPEVAAVVGDRLRRPDGLINEIVERTTGRLTDRVEQRIRATELSAECAELLHARTGAAALQIVRRYLDAGGAAAQATVSVHPADRFEFVVSMQRQEASGS